MHRTVLMQTLHPSLADAPTVELKHALRAWYVFMILCSSLRFGLW
jgi:hypothetical protein